MLLKFLKNQKDFPLRMSIICDNHNFMVDEYYVYVAELNLLTLRRHKRIKQNIYPSVRMDYICMNLFIKLICCNLHLCDKYNISLILLNVSGNNYISYEYCGISHKHIYHLYLAGQIAATYDDSFETLSLDQQFKSSLILHDLTQKFLSEPLEVIKKYKVFDKYAIIK